MKNSTQKRIADAYAACYQLCSQRGAVRAQAYLKKALDAARRGEAEHRKAGARFTRSAARYKLPIADAARFFAVKWFLDETPGPEDYTAAAGRFLMAPSLEASRPLKRHWKSPYLARSRVCLRVSLSSTARWSSASLT